jgi:hypothetical protein
LIFGSAVASRLEHTRPRKKGERYPNGRLKNQEPEFSPAASLLSLS